jgi:hypothetical protein
MEKFKIGDKVRSKINHNLTGTVSKISFDCFDYWYVKVDQIVTIMVDSEGGYKTEIQINANNIEKIEENKETKEMTSYKVGDLVKHNVFGDCVITDISDFENGNVLVALRDFPEAPIRPVSIYNIKKSNDISISIDDYNKMLNTIEKLRKEKVDLQEMVYNAYFGHKYNNLPEVKEVLYHNPATIIFWKDGTKTVVKAQNKEKYDKEKGFVMAYLKKILGNKGNYYKEIKRWTSI